MLARSQVLPSVRNCSLSDLFSYVLMQLLASSVLAICLSVQESKKISKCKYFYLHFFQKNNFRYRRKIRCINNFIRITSIFSTLKKSTFTYHIQYKFRTFSKYNTSSAENSITKITQSDFQKIICIFSHLKNKTFCKNSQQNLRY